MRAVTFHKDASRVRTGEGAQNVAVVRHGARNLLRHEAGTGSLRTKRFRAALDHAYLLRVLRAEMRLPHGRNMLY